MVDIQMKTLIKYIKQSYPKKSNEISEILELLFLELDDLFNDINKEVAEHHKNKEFDISKRLIEKSELVSEIQKIIDKYIKLLLADEKNEEGHDENTKDYFKSDIAEDTFDSEEQKNKINYEDYVVDSSIPHTLYEDYTHKKVHSFSFNNITYKVNDWRDLLLKTCTILSEIDANKFYRFINDPEMKGRNISYFSNQYIEDKNVKIGSLDVYVWVNLSANDIVKRVQKILKKFNIDLSNYIIYLRADYNPLHSAAYAGKDEHNINDNTTEKKIGKYVRDTMRYLSKTKHEFSNAEIKEMLSKEWSKKVLDIDYPLFKEYKTSIDISEQVKVGTYGRYWHELFEFNDKNYFITSQWYERHREPFKQWVSSFI